MATTVSKSESRPMTEEADFLQIKSVDHVHFYVGNAKHAMYYWWKAYGFKPVAYSGQSIGLLPGESWCNSHEPMGRNHPR